MQHTGYRYYLRSLALGSNMKLFEARNISVISMVRPLNKTLSSLMLPWIHLHFKEHFPLAAPKQNLVFWCETVWARKRYCWPSELSLWFLTPLCNPHKMEPGWWSGWTKHGCSCAKGDNQLPEFKRLCLCACQVNLDGDGHTDKPHHRPSVCFPGAALEALDEIGHPEQHREVGTSSREDLILLGQIWSCLQVMFFQLF